MSLTPLFTVSQSPLAPNLVTLEDVSTGSDVAVTQRRAYVQDVNGNYLVQSGVTTDYNQWALATNPISLDLLTQDTAVEITVQWLDVNNTVLYQKTSTFCLAAFNKLFLYELIQQQALNPTIIQDKDYDSNVATFWTTIIGGEQAIESGNDLAASQNCLDRGTYMRQNESKFF